MTKHTDYIKKNNFCIAPWIHLHVTPDGMAQPCCLWDYNVHRLNPERFGNINDVDTVNELMNSKGFSELRRQFAYTDELSEGCARCYDREASNGPSMRNWFNTTFNNEKVIQTVESTDENGDIHKLNIQYIDIRFGNICNLKCRMCGHGLSSSWFEESNKIAEVRGWGVSDKKFIHVDCFNKIEPLLANITEIYFAGGEPLLYQEHLMILDKLIEIGNTDLSIKYNTNLTTLKYKGRNFTDVWKHFKNVNIGASIDGMDSTIEYIRTNSSWTDIIDNFNTIKRDAPHVQIAPSPTLSILNIENFHEFEKYAILSSWYDNRHFALNYVMAPMFLNIYMLPKWYRIKLVALYNDHIEWLKSKNIDNTAEKIYELISRLKMDMYTDIEIDDSLVQLEKQLNLFDITGKLDWKASVPHVFNMLEEHKRRKLV